MKSEPMVIIRHDGINTIIETVDEDDYQNDKDLWFPVNDMASFVKDCTRVLGELTDYNIARCREAEERIRQHEAALLQEQAEREGWDD